MTMDDEDEVTVWLRNLTRGDPRAGQVLWDRYFERLVSYARRKLEGMPRRVADEEDVALSAMQSFCQGAAEGRFPQLNDRQDLWKLLITIAARKAHKQRRKQATSKRGGGLVRGESVFFQVGADEAGAGLDQAVGAEPTPEFALEVAEECERRMACLDDSLREIALYRLAGLTHVEIAAKLGCAVRTVERKAERIRAQWEQQDLATDS